MNPITEKKSTVSEAVHKHKEFLFPAVATYYEEPVALVKGEGDIRLGRRGKQISRLFRRRFNRQCRTRESEN